MRAVWITKHGGPEVLEVRETPTPDPKPGEVRVKVAFAGLNFAELSARQGLYPDAPKPPCVVGYEGSGVVEAVGAGVEAVKEGDRVAYMSRFGGHSSHVVVPDDQVVRIPDAMSFEHAAAMPVNYLTAHHMLFEIARIRPGAHVLVHMAAGGVGTAALQLCRTVDDVTTYGTASGGKHDYVRTHGCTHPIDYRTQDYATEIMRLTEGRGVDVVLDALGGGDWRKGYALLRPVGILIAFGLANSNIGGKRGPAMYLNLIKQLVRMPRFSPMTLMNDNRTVSGCNMGHLWDEKALLRRQLDALVRFYEQGAIEPHVHAIHSFDAAAAAFSELELGKNVGKVLLQP
ncbi:synaptic vesicle VAT-1 family membrane protein [Paraliomyxa miuraensis]|uniref:synaptic vesicle VAT-1 family membrane protein n=1 Tax=Paraliomyxa miuraensis TaxID=376150 RepID=UPI002250B968|nr:medium chain dehydrogenase/reductase family protein [Paraliomyxa miuraensis]MCX4239946.1 medium chain dehydrogenase/reductase family protein [Paraliomyxa miuraensis]